MITESDQGIKVPDPLYSLNIIFHSTCSQQTLTIAGQTEILFIRIRIFVVYRQFQVGVTLSNLTIKYFFFFYTP